jgi:MYXO-CTERM domain-containing protein
MATSLAPDTRNKDWTEISAADPKPARAEWLWTLLGLALLGAFLSLVVDDSPLRTLIAGN